jgi:hypothetical protein
MITIASTILSTHAKRIMKRVNTAPRLGIEQSQGQEKVGGSRSSFFEKLYDPFTRRGPMG